LLGWAAKLAREGKDFKAERTRSADVGTAIHDCLERYEETPARAAWMDDGEWARLLDARKAWVGWLTDFSPEIIAQERQLVSVKYRAGGTFDNLIRLNGKVYVGDHKSGKSVDRAKVSAQLAFYGALVQETMGIGVDGALVFHYPANGKFRVIEMGMEELTRGMELFQAARKIYDLLRQARNA
jgi:RecB family exonuclease